MCSSNYRGGLTMKGCRIIPLTVLILEVQFAHSETIDLDLVLDRFTSMELEMARLTQRVSDLEMSKERQTEHIVVLQNQIDVLTKQVSDLQLQQLESKEIVRGFEVSGALLRGTADTTHVGLGESHLDTESQREHVQDTASPIIGNRSITNDNGGNPEIPLPSTQRNGRGIANEGQQVAFTAYIAPHDYGPLGKDQIIVFANVRTNIGNAYHAHDGIFTAPVNGVYVFSVTIASWHQSTGRSYVHVKVNNGGVCTIWTGGGEQSSQMFILNLNQNDDVYAQNVYATDILLGQGYSSFSGLLLYYTS